MTPKTKAILKTAGALAAGAVTFAYLPLVSFAVAPQAMGLVHVGLAAFHPALGEALLATGVLAGVGLSIKKTWAHFRADKRMEEKIEEIIERKKALQQKKNSNKKQQEMAKQQTRQQEKSAEKEAPTKEGKKPLLKVPNISLTRATLKFLRRRRQKEAA